MVAGRSPGWSLRTRETVVRARPTNRANSAVDRMTGGVFRADRRGGVDLLTKGGWRGPSYEGAWALRMRISCLPWLHGQGRLESLNIAFPWRRTDRRFGRALQVVILQQVLNKLWTV